MASAPQLDTSRPILRTTNTGPSNALTSDLFQQADQLQAFARDRTRVVDQFVSDLSNAVLDLVPPTITPEFNTGPTIPAIVSPTLPDFVEPEWVAPGLPALFAGDLDITDLQVQPFDGTPPTLNYGAAPADFAGALPTAPAVNLDFTDPTLSVDLPEAPVLLELNVTQFEGFNLPTFDGDEPTLTAVAPSLREYTPGASYTSSLLGALQQKLEAAMTTETTGLDPTVEEAMWERGREREARAYADAVKKIDEMEALGYAMPPGWFADARLKLITETDFAERGHSREVMIKQAELSLDFVKHAMTNAVQLESQLMDLTNAVEQRLFESARYATEAGVSIYNAQVQSYSAMVDLYRTKVAIYEAQVRAEVSKVEAYRAEVAAEEAKASINRTLVEQYRVQIDAALSNIRIYEAEIAGIQTKAEIERTKVQVFGEQVRAYVAEINAYTAGVEGYRTRIQAEGVKQDVFKSQVDAFAAQVQASVSQIEARIAAYRGQIEAKTVEYEGYRAAVAGETARVQAITSQNTVIAEAFRSEVAAVTSHNEVLTRQWQAILDQNQRTTEIAIAAAEVNSQLYVTTRSIALDAVKTGAQVAAQIGSAAINAVNFSGSVSSSEGYQTSESLSVSESNSFSSSASTSTNYNFNASV